MQDYSQLLLRDYSRNASVLIAAVDISAEDLIIGKGDPGRLMPIEATGKVIFVVHEIISVYLSVIRIQTAQALLWLIFRIICGCDVLC